MKFLLTICIILLLSVAKADEQYIDKGFKLSLKPSGEYAILSFELEDDVKIYWRHPGELGMATKFSFNNSSNLASTKVFWPAPTLNKTSYVYQKNISFVIKPNPYRINEAIKLAVLANFTICSNTCDNHEVVLKTNLSPSASESDEAFNLLSKMPKENGSEGLKVISSFQEKIEQQYWLNIKFTSDLKVKNPKIFLDLPEYVQFDPIKFELSDETDGQLIRIPVTLLNKNEAIDQIYCNLVDDSGNVIEYEHIDSSKANSYSFVWIILYALLGGLVLNFMPCVLPILALKALQLIKLSGKEHSLIRRSLIAQSLGIIVSFIMVALITYGLQQAGKQVGFGLQFQQPLYLITMVIILSVIAINLVENIDLNIKIPSVITKLFSSDKMDMIGFFSSGVLVTMLAIPCTAPFITIAVGFALTTNFLKMIIIFSCMGIGMAIPYILLSCFPTLARIFPKSGNWMLAFKKILGMLIFVTAIWLIYVISTQLGNKAAIVLFLIVILIKFVLVDKKIFNTRLKLILSLILFILCYVMPYHLYEEKKQEVRLAEEVWQDYKPSQISSLIDKGNIVLLDVTASWCATCNINKVTTLNNTIVMDFMKKREIIGMRADISIGNTPDVSTLMKIHNHYGIPLNIVYSKKFPAGMILPIFLTPNILIEAIKKAGV